jgi:nitroimidazol reductase NimA-like FMN-containing flavoprotein (pyridoxamine 5'-phosphate oxidase superfamily)
VNRDTFLAHRRVAVLATLDPDGAAYLTAVWFLWVNGAFLVPTSGESRKGRNAAARSRASILVDERSGTLRGVAAAGRVEVIRGEEAFEFNRHIHRRYVTENGMADPALGGLLAESDDITIRLLPERWQTWDLEPVFEDRLGDAELVYPLAP